MGVYIKGMEMPSSCSKCSLVTEYYEGGLPVCCLLDKYADTSGLKLDDCPLVPVPPHGALMDRDDFFATCSELVDGYKHITDEFVVIPAEEGE